MIRTPLAALAALLMLGASAAAQSGGLDTLRPILKAEAVVTGDIVRIGDIVDNAGIVAKVPIFRAPDLGYTGKVSVDAVVDAVRTHALIGLDTAGLTEVSVTRAARSIPAAEIEDAIAEALASQHDLGAAKNVAVTFDREMRAIYVEPSAAGTPRVGHVNFDTRSGRFEATLHIPTGAGNRGTLRLTGRAQAMIDVVTVTRQIERGSVLKAADIVMERQPRKTVSRDAITDRDEALGLAARGVLQPGRPLRHAELMKPEIVKRNEAVTLIYEMPGIMLTVRGKAAEAGAEGDSIAVLNEQSKRTVHATVVGPGRVAITATQPRLAANVAPPATPPPAAPDKR